MWSGLFWKQAAERGIKSAAQALIGLWTLDGVFNILNVDAELAAGTSAGAFVLSVLFSLVSSGIGPDNSPSVVGHESTPNTL